MLLNKNKETKQNLKQNASGWNKKVSLHKRTSSFQSKSFCNQLEAPPVASPPKNEFALTETLEIISEIQNQFDNSVKENKKPLEEIKRLIDNNLNINNYIALSDLQKENITNDIERSSELRIQNYNTAFNYIRTSLEGIKDCLEKIVSNEEESEDDIIESDDNSENKTTFLTYRESSTKQGDNEEDTDFSEGVMLENAFVLPPKNSPFNYQNVKDMTRTRSKKFSVMNHEGFNKKKMKEEKDKRIKKVMDTIKEVKIPNKEKDSKVDKEDKSKEGDNCFIF